MSKVRYFLSVAVSVATLVLFLVLLTDWDFLMRLIIGYMMGAIMGELVFWDYSLATRILKLLLRIVAIIFVFWIGWFGSGLVGIIIGFVLATPLFSAMGAVFSFAMSLFIPLSAILFPIHLVSYAFMLE